MFSKISTFAVTSVLASLAFALPEPQTPAITSKYQADVLGYIGSVLAPLETNTPLASSIESIISSLVGSDEIQTSDLAAFPTSVQVLVESAVSVLDDIASSDSFSGTLDITVSIEPDASTSASSSATATGSPSTTGSSSSTASAGSTVSMTSAASTSASTAAASASSALTGAAPTGRAVGLSAAALGGLVAVVMAL